MTRLIDADALEKAIYEWMPKNQEEWLDGDLPPIENLVVSIMMTIQEQPTIDAEPQWIPCSEMLPKDDRSKVVTLANGNTEVGYYSNGDWWCIGDSFRLENPTVIAWMPLPKPYEGDKE